MKPDKKAHSKSQASSSSRPNKLTGKSVLRDIPVPRELVQKYTRGGDTVSTGNVKFKALKRSLQETKDTILDAAVKNASTEVLLPSEIGYIESTEKRVFKIKQKELRDSVDMNTARNMMDLHLTNFGPYRTDFTRNGRYLLFGGKRGHVAVLDCMKLRVGTELQLQEEVYDVQYLQNETMFAVAQNKYVYIYDYKGVEIHCMKDHERPYRLDFLPYHYLLASCGHSGWIKWHDISTGTYVAGYGSGHGPCKVMTHNPKNAVSHLGHSNGVVSLWSPASGKALVSMFCHKAPLSDIAIDREGRYMATAGLDGFLKIWDLRQYRLLHAYKPDRPVTTLDISDTGLLALGLGRSVQVLKDAFTRPTDITYLQHELRPAGIAHCSGGGVTAAVNALASSMAVCTVSFRPYEDVLSIGHSHGISSIVVPGAGEANFDSFEANPFMNPKQRREAEVKSLLYKLQPEMIGLDESFIGTVDTEQTALQEEHREVFKGANKQEIEKVVGHKARGRNKISAKLRRKQKNVIDASVIKLREKMKKKVEEDSRQLSSDEKRELMRKKHGALARFFPNQST